MLYNQTEMLSSAVSNRHNSDYKKIKHFEYVDALRGIAVLGVLFVHCAIMTKQQGVVYQIGFMGQRGVQLFYLISAFTLYNSMQYRRGEKSELRNFYIRRFFRIAPLFYLAIILNLLYDGIPPGLQAYDIVLGFLFLNGFKPSAINAIAIGGWSIAVETTFYIILPFLFAYITNYKKALLLTLLSGAILYPLMRVAVLFFGQEYKEYFTFLTFPIQFPIFCLGILGYFIWKELTALKSALGGYKKQLSLFCLLLSAIILGLSFPSTNNNMYLTSFGLLLPIIALSQHPWKLLVNRFTLNLGKISYSMYLMHFFVIIAFNSIVPYYFPAQYQQLLGRPIGLLVSFCSILVVSVIISTITYLLIEHYGIKAGNLIIKRLEYKREVILPALQ